MRAIVSNVASNDALARLSEDVHALSAKVDQLVARRRQQRCAGHARTAHRGADLDDGNARAAGRQRQLRISRRRDALAVRTARSHAGRQRQRVGIRPSRTARVLSAGAPGELPATDRSAAAISAASRKGCRTSCAISNTSTPIWPRSPTTASSYSAPRRSMDSGMVDIVKRELSDIRFSQSETDRRTQDRWKPFTARSAMSSIASR